VLSIERGRKSYHGAAGSVQVLAGVSLEVRPGEFVVVRGPSGSGKTTLLLTAGALLRPDEGTVVLSGRDPYALAPNQRAGLRAEMIGFVFQQFHLIGSLSVLENVLAAALARRLPDARDRASELIERFGLGDRAGHLPGQLSTGERQRAALARAMLNRPKLLLADEPTGNLDEDNGREVLAALAEFAAAGGAVLLVTHDRAAEGFGGRVLHLDRGRLGEPGDAAPGA